MTIALTRARVVVMLLAALLLSAGPLASQMASAGQMPIAAASDDQRASPCPDYDGTMPATNLAACAVASCASPASLPARGPQPDRTTAAVYFAAPAPAVAGVSPTPDPGPPRLS